MWCETKKRELKMDGISASLAYKITSYDIINSEVPRWETYNQHISMARLLIWNQKTDFSRPYPELVIWDEL